MDHPMTVRADNRQVCQMCGVSFGELSNRDPVVALSETVAEFAVLHSKVKTARFAKETTGFFEHLLFFPLDSLTIALLSPMNRGQQLALRELFVLSDGVVAGPRFFGYLRRALRDGLGGLVKTRNVVLEFVPNFPIEPTATL